MTPEQETAALATQARLVAALRNPSCYPHPVEAVEHLETHISHVLLAGEFAYKLKKPLDLGFLDFSTFEKRRFYCAEEVRLNRRLAPQLYLDVLPIRGDIGTPRIGGTTGAILDHAVRMRRFPQEALFDEMARRGTLGDRHIDSLAAIVAAFHADCARSDAGSPWGSAESVAAPMRQNFSQLRPLVLDAAEIARLDALEAWSEREHARLAATFETRRRDGWVRECHGDLHLGNVAWLDESAQPFDGIEFNAGLRWIDVVAESAFMVMDLIEHGLAPLAWRFLDGWLERSGDFAGIDLLRYYVVYRAMVRAKIAVLRGSQPGIGAEARRAALTEHAQYMTLAANFTAPRAPALIVTNGLSGSGKSVLAGTVCTQLGAIRVRSDVERKRLSGLAPLARSAASSTPGGGIYDAETTRATYAELARLAGTILDAGWPAVIDAAFLKREERELLRDVARTRNVPLLFVTCTADDTTLRERIAQRQAGESDASEATLEVLEKQRHWQEALDEPPQPGETRLTIDTARTANDTAVARLAAALAG